MLQRPSGVVEPLPLMTLRAGQAPVRQGEPSGGPWVVESGLLRVTRVREDGRELILDLFGPGDPVGDGTGRPSAWTVQAQRPARLLGVPPSVGAARAPEVLERLAALTVDLAWLDVASRLERRLEDVALRLGSPVPGGFRLPARFTQEELATFVGSSRESTNRAVRDLVRRGSLMHEGRGRYVVRTPLQAVGA